MPYAAGGTGIYEQEENVDRQLKEIGTETKGASLHDVIVVLGLGALTLAILVIVVLYVP